LLLLCQLDILELFLLVDCNILLETEMLFVKELFEARCTHFIRVDESSQNFVRLFRSEFRGHHLVKQCMVSFVECIGWRCDSFDTSLCVHTLLRRRDLDFDGRVQLIALLLLDDEVRLD